MKILIALLLVLALTQAGNAVRILHLPAGITTSLILPLEVFLGGFWAVLSVGMAVAIWRHSRATRRGWVLLMMFCLYIVARQVIFTRADYDRQRLPFLLLVAAVVIVIVLVQEKISKHGSE
jgi:glucose-6-phosphate-specific signal transduction histidine kinase